MRSSIARLSTDLATLAKLDAQRRIFGARSHRYSNVCVLIDELDALERELNVALPDDFRTFLLEIGFGGGPYYGIFSPDEIRKERAEWKGAESAPVEDRECKPGTGRADIEFPVSRTELIGALANPEWPCVRIPWNPDGAIPICHHGCMFWTILVTTGELRGVVLDYYTDHEAGTSAHVPPTVDDIEPSAKLISETPTFADWFAAWIENSLRDLAHL
ncbi:MAG: hypothetical protein AMXMBFR47_11330 [Planctomycetota bacterium]